MSGSLSRFLERPLRTLAATTVTKEAQTSAVNGGLREMSKVGSPLAYAPALLLLLQDFCILIQGVDNPDQAHLRPAPAPPFLPRYSRS